MDDSDGAFGCITTVAVVIGIYFLIQLFRTIFIGIGYLLLLTLAIIAGGLTIYLIYDVFEEIFQRRSIKLYKENLTALEIKIKELVEEIYQVRRSLKEEIAELRGCTDENNAKINDLEMEENALKEVQKDFLNRLRGMNRFGINLSFWRNIFSNNRSEINSKLVDEQLKLEQLENDFIDINTKFDIEYFDKLELESNESNLELRDLDSYDENDIIEDHNDNEMNKF